MVYTSLWNELSSTVKVINSTMSISNRKRSNACYLVFLSVLDRRLRLRLDFDQSEERKPISSLMNFALID